MVRVRLRVWLTIFLLFSVSANGATFRMVRSQSGPSGKIVDNRFQFDEIRNRFVYPQDRFITVYFEWEGPAGDHVLSAYWKDPKGMVASISPDIKMQTKTAELHAYWIFEISPTFSSGIWTAEVRIDGEPSGSQSFELVLPAAPASTEAPPAQPKLPTLDDLYASVGRSLVWIYKLDDTGRRTDTALGFVIGTDHIATAFQAIDGASRVEVVFGDGRKIVTDQIWAAHRLQDWAVLKAETASVPALHRAMDATIPVGERYIVFNVEHQSARVIGGVDITGKRSAGDFGDRIQLSPSPAPEAVGGPLLNPAGDVSGIIGGSVIPGSRFGQYVMSLSPALWFRLKDEISATPIAAVTVAEPASAVTLADLRATGILTPPLDPSPSVIYGATARSAPKYANDASTDTSEFSRRDSVVWVYTMWQKKEKVGKGMMAAKVYDSRNRLVVDVAPKKASLPDSLPALRVAFNFGIQNFQPGDYRVDVLWNDRPAWRTFFHISE